MQVQFGVRGNAPWAAETQVGHQRVTRNEDVAPVRELAGVPPEGGLPSTSQVLSQLTPSDRAAIAGATGYRLSPTGAITNPGGIPPWTYILGYAERRSAERNEVVPPAIDARPPAAEAIRSAAYVDVVA